MLRPRHSILSPKTKNMSGRGGGGPLIPVGCALLRHWQGNATEPRSAPGRDRSKTKYVTRGRTARATHGTAIATIRDDKVAVSAGLADRETAQAPLPASIAFTFPNPRFSMIQPLRSATDHSRPEARDARDSVPNPDP